MVRACLAGGRPIHDAAGLSIAEGYVAHAEEEIRAGYSVQRLLESARRSLMRSARPERFPRLPYAVNLSIWTRLSMCEPRLWKLAAVLRSLDFGEVGPKAIEEGLDSLPVAHRAAQRASRATDWRLELIARPRGAISPLFSLFSAYRSCPKVVAARSGTAFATSLQHECATGSPGVDGGSDGGPGLRVLRLRSPRWARPHRPVPRALDGVSRVPAARGTARRRQAVVFCATDKPSSPPTPTSPRGGSKSGAFARARTRPSILRARESMSVRPVRLILHTRRAGITMGATRRPGAKLAPRPLYTPSPML